MSAISLPRRVPIRLPAMAAEGRSCGALATALAAFTVERLVLLLRPNTILSLLMQIGLVCVYETKRVKPGLKAGAVENLHKRLGNSTQGITFQKASDFIQMPWNEWYRDRKRWAKEIFWSQTMIQSLQSLQSPRIAHSKTRRPTISWRY